MRIMAIAALPGAEDRAKMVSSDGIDVSSRCNMPEAWLQALSLCVLEPWWIPTAKAPNGAALAGPID
jgi:hypothetical protein